jgi:hypothetical protein
MQNSCGNIIIKADGLQSADIACEKGLLFSINPMYTLSQNGYGSHGYYWFIYAQLDLTTSYHDK